MKQTIVSLSLSLGPLRCIHTGNRGLLFEIAESFYVCSRVASDRVTAQVKG